MNIVVVIGEILIALGSPRALYAYTIGKLADMVLLLGINRIDLDA